MNSEWSKLAIGSFARLRSGYSFKSADWKSAGNAVVKIANIKAGRIDPEGCGYVDDEVAASAAEWWTRPGDVLIAMTGYVGEVAKVRRGERYLINQRVGRFDFADESPVEPAFFFYALQQTDFRRLIEGVARGSAQPNLSSSDAHKLAVPVPPKAIQVEISALLGALDDRITLLRETNATLEAIAQAQFKSWFVDFDPVRAKSQGLPPAGMDEATAALFADGFEESALGPLPRAWEITKLGEEAAYLNRGISPKYLETGGVQVLNQKCIRDFAVDQAKARRHDTTQRSIAGRELHVGDVLVNSTGVGTLGRVAQVLALNETTIVDSHVTVVRAGGRFTWNYLGLAMMRRQAEIEELGEGSTGQTELSKGKLAQLEFTVPPEPVLRAFDAVTVPLRLKMSANSQQAQTLATLRDTLLPRLISGQLRLPEARQAIEESTA